MSAEHASEEKKGKVKRQETAAERESAKQKNRSAHEGNEPASTVSALQNLVGNRAVQRLLAQRSDEAPFELDQDTESRINSQRGGGQSLDEGVQSNLEGSMGYDFSNVRVHTSPESDDLNKQLGAKAFTTGSDIFFREGQYAPQSSAGQELIAHEATHVVQQSTGAVSSGPGMTVNAPGDVFEQEADSVASQVMRSTQQPAVQRDPLTEEEEVQAQEMPEEEEELVQAQEEEEDLVQAQDMPEEEELVQTQEMPEEEELVQAQEMPEEEEMIQTQAMPEEEDVLQSKRDR